MRAIKWMVGGATVLAVVLTSGCTRDHGQSSPAPATRVAPTAIGGGPPPTEMAIDRLGEARCEREARCGRLGPEGSYDTRQQCLDADLMSRLDVLDPANCPNGIRSDLLEACIEAMRTERCDSDSRSSGCTVQSLCAP
jgi:hypothetical protein